MRRELLRLARSDKALKKEKRSGGEEKGKRQRTRCLTKYAYAMSSPRIVKKWREGPTPGEKGGTGSDFVVERTRWTVQMCSLVLWAAGSRFDCFFGAFGSAGRTGCVHASWNPYDSWTPLDRTRVGIRDETGRHPKNVDIVAKYFIATGPLQIQVMTVRLFEH